MRPSLFIFLLFILPVTVLSQGSILKVTGEVATPLSLSAADIATMPHLTVDFRDRNGEVVPYTGVPMNALLTKAGVTLGSQLRGENLSKFVLVKCSDGYEVLFSLAEMDSSFTGRSIILADQSRGKPLPVDKGPFRIIVPGERVPARSSFQVVELVIGFVNEKDQ